VFRLLCEFSLSSLVTLFAVAHVLERLEIGGKLLTKKIVSVMDFSSVWLQK
jgi:hypothetical protein